MNDGLKQKPTRADVLGEAENTAAGRKWLTHYHSHPEFYRQFVAFTNIAKKKKAHFSADMIAHRIRWETMITDKPEATYKVNDNYISLYVRLYIATFHPPVQFFELRRLKVLPNDPVFEWVQWQKRQAAQPHINPPTPGYVQRSSGQDQS